MLESLGADPRIAANLVERGSLQHSSSLVQRMLKLRLTSGEHHNGRPGIAQQHQRGSCYGAEPQIRMMHNGLLKVDRHK
jgi:hypothetical protein